MKDSIMTIVQFEMENGRTLQQSHLKYLSREEIERYAASRDWRVLKYEITTYTKKLSKVS